MTENPNTCRQAFEDWYAEPGCRSIERSGEGYKLMQAHQAWVAWQAAWDSFKQLSQIKHFGKVS